MLIIAPGNIVIRISGVPATMCATTIAPLIITNAIGALIAPLKPRRLIIWYKRRKNSAVRRVETKLITPWVMPTRTRASIPYSQLTNSPQEIKNIEATSAMSKDSMMPDLRKGFDPLPALDSEISSSIKSPIKIMNRSAMLPLSSRLNSAFVIAFCSLIEAQSHLFTTPNTQLLLPQTLSFPSFPPGVSRTRPILRLHGRHT